MTDLSEQALTGRIAELSTPSRLGEKTTLDPILRLLDKLGHPERAYPTLHVGGTSGKGSTATLLANILSDAGYRVGLFTKPHLTTVRERFIIDGEPISAEKLMALLDRAAAFNDEKPTWFELTAALAFQYFADAQVDCAVIEVGLGGALDATNVIDPELSILTNVGLDHTDVLGDTVEQIAADKVGIFKPGRPVVSGVKQPSVIEIVEQAAARTGSPLRQAGHDFYAGDVRLDAGGATFDFVAPDEPLDELRIAMPGAHQVENACTAAAAVLSLRELGWLIPLPAIRSGLARTQAPGRMEVAGRDPLILLDGAHSPPKMHALAQAVEQLYGPDRRVIGVLSFSKGHDAASSLAALAPRLDAAVLTEFRAETDYGNKRAQSLDDLAAALAALNPQTQITRQPDPIQAVQAARDLAGPQDIILITGSIFLVGQVRPFFQERSE